MIEVPIPERMSLLELDPRGYPVPYTVLVDDEGRPQFAANDGERRFRCIVNKLCQICGKKLDKELWFVGGPGSSFHEDGCFLDPAMHHECATYALQVCPHLAMRTYRTRPFEAKVSGISTDALLLDPTIDPRRPEVFVAVMAFGQSVGGSLEGSFIKPLRPYHAVEFWREGKRLPTLEGVALATRSVGAAAVALAMRLVLTDKELE